MKEDPQQQEGVASKHIIQFTFLSKWPRASTRMELGCREAVLLPILPSLFEEESGDFVLADHLGGAELGKWSTFSR